MAVPHPSVDPHLRTTTPATGFHVNLVQRLQQLRRLAKLEGLTVGILQRELLTLPSHLQGKPPLLVGGPLWRRPSADFIPVEIVPLPPGMF